MGSEYTFFDYAVDGEEGIVRAWLRDMPAMVRKKLNTQIGYLEATPHAQWKRPYVAAVGDGLLEIRVEGSDRKNYRILLTHTPGRRPTLLHGFIKPGDPIPAQDRARAKGRRAEVRGTDPESHRVEYRHD
ncbi:MAG: type II toxin-antitoxin system RelE/ParE family toxin [Dehalococcoidia bacterium]